VGVGQGVVDLPALISGDNQAAAAQAAGQMIRHGRSGEFELLR
jgi:hypothetical protein